MFQEKPPSRVTQKREKSRAKALHWRAVVRTVMQRDGYKCRACGTRGEPYNPVDPHHIRFRSRGGADTTANTCAMCRECHDEIHAYRLSVIGDDANGPLQFERRAPQLHEPGDISDY